MVESSSYEEFDDVLPEELGGEVVHWMEPRPLTFGLAGLSLAVAGAFALGLAAALIAVSLSHRGERERPPALPPARRLRRLH
jgi:hypothetical protein